MQEYGITNPEQLDVGYRRQDCRRQDAGVRDYKSRTARCRIQEAGYRRQDCRRQDAGGRILHLGFVIEVEILHSAKATFRSTTSYIYGLLLL